jgi:hypothetical protein|tara:strand:+ start:344 stop:490 length:147 start_codon:yes stop_codon:yes gene_type:complete
LSQAWCNFWQPTEEQNMDGNIIAMTFAVLHILWVLPTIYFLTLIVLNR